ncbi:vWA domain-containing protein [Rosistilla oblonga]|uniref:vWA domain-containing protein n=1 Tax=Rosistilla oblonga TaxID=2527990 RepID=UPI003A979AE1
MSEIEFRDPWLLLLALLAPLVFVWASRRPSMLVYSSLAILDQGPRSVRVRLAKLPALLMALTLIALSIAIAGPRTPDAETRISREGVAIMMVVDHSSSMNARDLVKDDQSVDRLQVVKQVFRQFVLGDEGTAGKGRPDDAIGLIAFAGYADSLCPLTLDHGNLVAMLDDLELVRREDEDGTAIGDGLALAVERLRRSEAKSRIVILLTDGVNNAGAIVPKEAAEVAAANNIKVYSIGAGTNGLAPIPMQDPFGRMRLVRAEVEIDEETLTEIADVTGGQYFRAVDIDALGEIYEQIDRLERTKVTEFRYLQYTEHYGTFALLGLCLMGTAVVLGSTVFRTLP